MNCKRCKRCECNDKSFKGKSKEELRKMFEDAAIEKGIKIITRDVEDYPWEE